MKLARALVKAVRGAASVVRDPLYVPAGHYYSPVPARRDVERAVRVDRRVGRLPGIELHEARQRELAVELAPLWADVPTGHFADWRYRPDNPMFGLADAALYYSLLARLRSRNVVEVGSGFSSAIALDATDRFALECAFTFVEPYPERLLGLLRPEDRARCEVVPTPVQDVPPEVFDRLGPDDVLFIDSTHVSKAGSDVNHLFFEVLPRLAAGVVVHVHDVFWPFEYPVDWLREGRNWTEDYLLRAFLSYNSAFEVLLFGSWLWQVERDLVRDVWPRAAGQTPGSIWLRKTAT
ncbi:class I SAM-dependent methyltransferase [Saccharothrix syringae]|uniref:Class I SAM-dependent methyltransferase n=1 Tax=Saccharothrix syringae TaxID=103733 RepID=A0A5Q0H075_SACSY|nr:class I SAM-dependent methyltransferase [Saccharothrix syringae]QFZ19513.1 class I SAM-dependent methyltransferase [Saccharothrix syringae]